MNSTATFTPPVLQHLREIHAAERAQLSELRILRDKCDVASIRALLEQHTEKTVHHGDLLDARLTELGSGPSVLQLVEEFGATMAKGVVERLRPLDTCDVLREAITAEATEIADYLVLEFEAVRAGDASTEVLAGELRMDELLTRDALRRCWHLAARRDVESRRSHTDAHALIVHHLQMAHTVEQMAAGALLANAPLVPSATARARMDDHRMNSRRQARDICHRLHELDARIPMLPSVGNAVSSIALAPLHLVRAPQPKRIVRDLYVTEFLEIATYEQMAATAELLGDECTADLARRHIPEELAMVDWIERHVDGFIM